MPKIRKMGAKDSQLAYYINQLEAFDPRLNEPLIDVTWSRDIKLRSDVSLANAAGSFTRQDFAGAGSLSATGKPWVNKTSTSIQGVSVNGEKIVQPIRPLARQVDFTSIELAQSQLLQQPIDQQKMMALQSLYQMDVDNQVYIGDSELGDEGLLNSSQVTSALVANNAGATSRLWVNKTVDEIIKDLNELLYAAWEASGFAVMPTDVLLPPAKFGYLVSQKVSSAGNISILEYFLQNNICKAQSNIQLSVRPVKWATNRGTGGSIDRMCAYHNSERFLRFPLVPIQRETAYYQGITFFSPYLYAMGQVEFIYPETVRYADGF